MTALRAARASNIKPTSMLFHTQPNEPWKSVDFALLVALQILEEETCGQCGQPLWICRSNDRDVYFKVESSICYASRRMREKEFEKMDAKSKKNVTKAEKKDWGVSYYPVPAIRPNADRERMPTRKEYYESRMVK